MAAGEAQDRDEPVRNPFGPSGALACLMHRMFQSGGQDRFCLEMFQRRNLSRVPYEGISTSCPWRH